MPVKDLVKRITQGAEQILSEYEAKKDLSESPDELLNLQWKALAENDPRDLRYVIDENCLVVSPTLATVFDIEKAIIIQQIHYFVCINRQRKESDCYKKRGHYCMYCTPAKWREMLPFISPTSLKRKMKELERAGVVVRFQSHEDDYLTYYRLDYKALEKQINDFLPEKRSFKLSNLKYIMGRVHLDKKTSVIMGDSQKSGL